MPCSGSTSFQATYGGETTNVLALVTPALNKEVILSWRTLQRLKVIPKDFPSPVPLHVKVATSKAKKKQSNLVKSEEAINLNETIEELMDQYQEVFKTNDLDQLKTMKGEAMKIELVDGPIKPLHVNKPRKAPYSYQGASKAKLDKLVSLGILESVEGSIDWISPMSFVPKPDGDVCLVADLVHLNK